MSAHLILDSDWSVYSDYKQCIGQNPDIFLTGDVWEVGYLIEKITTWYPLYPSIVIELSIHMVKRTLYGGCKRSLFVQLVMNNLLLREPMLIP